MKFSPASVLSALPLVLLLAGCNYDVPLTAAPTRAVDERLIGNWTPTDGTAKLRIRKFDEHTLVVSCDNDLLRAWHSDFEGIPFISAQCLDPDNHTWLYIKYQVEKDGRRLSLQSVQTSLIPKESVKTSQDAQALVKKNLKNPGLYGTGDDSVGIYNKD